MSDLIKWSGSKQFLAEEIILHFPKDINTYFEPFIGGGSVFLKLLESDISIKRFVISDTCLPLIQIWEYVKNNPDRLISNYRELHTNLNKEDDIQYRKDYYNSVRQEFNKSKDSILFYFLTRTCYNGLIRFNNKGEFNVSYHIHRKGMSPDKVERIVKKYNRLLNNIDIEILHLNYTELDEEEKDFIYFDPPYENTKSQYYGSFDNTLFIKDLDFFECKWALSYDGFANDVDRLKNESGHNIESKYKEIILKKHNSSFSRLKMVDLDVKERLILNYEY